MKRLSRYTNILKRHPSEYSLLVVENAVDPLRDGVLVRVAVLGHAYGDSPAAEGLHVFHSAVLAALSEWCVSPFGESLIPEISVSSTLSGVRG